MGNYIPPSSSLFFRRDLYCLIISPIFFTLRASLGALFSVFHLYSVEVTFLLHGFFLCVFLTRKVSRADILECTVLGNALRRLLCGYEKGKPF